MRRLRPASYTRFDAVARKVTVYDLIVEHVVRVCGHRMWARADKRQ